MSKPAGGGPQKSFEQIIERLEGIAAKLESGNPTLEEALAMFEEGVGLSREGNTRLDNAQERLDVLLGEENGEGYRLEEFSPPGQHRPDG